MGLALNSTLLHYLVMIAGLANGAFLAPVGKKTININIIWIVFGILIYFIFPLIILIFDIFLGQYKFSFSATFTLFATGLLYGYGIYLLTLSIKHIGMGLPLAFNISLGILTGSFFSIVVSGNFFHLVDQETYLSYSLILVAVILYTIALSIRDGGGNNRNWKVGFIYAFLGSLLASSQGAALSFYSDAIKQSGNGFIQQLTPWALIFLGCSVIFISSYGIKLVKNKNEHIESKLSIVWRSVTMALLQIISVLIYTYANVHTKQYSQEYLWGIFMVCIILSSTFFSYCKSEWRNSSAIANIFNFSAIALLVCAVSLLSKLAN